MAAIDILMDLESEMVDDADEIEDDASRAPSRVSRMTGKTRGSKRSVSRAKSRSSIGSGTRRGSVGASTSVLSSTVIENDDSEGIPRRMEVNQLDQIIRAFCILARVAKRLDERQHFLLLGQMYVKKLLSQVMGACNLKASVSAFTELSESERGEQTYQEWMLQPPNTNTLGLLAIPGSDLEWCNYNIFESASKIVSENNDTAIFSSGQPAISILQENDISKMNFINKNTILNLARTLDFLNEMAAMLVESGYNIYAAPVYHLVYLCNIALGGDNTGSLTRLTCSRMALNYDALNLKERCKQAFEKCGDCLPSVEELKVYEEDISQREQALLDRNESVSSSPGGIKRRGDSMSRLRVSGIHVRYVWIDQAVVCCKLGNINSAKTLLVESLRHSKAYEDKYCINCINSISADVKLMEGKLEEGLKYSEISIYGNATTVDIYTAVTSILRRCSIYAKTRKQSIAMKILKNAIEAFDALISLARTGEEVGIGILKKKRIGSSPSPPRKNPNLTVEANKLDAAGDLDIRKATLKCSAQLAVLQAEECYNLLNQGSPFEDDWKRCNLLFERVLQDLETLGFDGLLLPDVVDSYVDAIIKMGLKGVAAVRGLDEKEMKSLDKYECDTLSIDLLKRSMAHATRALKNSKPSENTDPVTLELNLPIERRLATIKVRLARFYRKRSINDSELEEEKSRRKRMDLRRMNASKAKHGGSDTIIDKWLKATEPKPPVTDAEKEISMCGNSVILSSSAHVVGATVEKIKAKSLSSLGCSILHSAEVEGELLGRWLSSGAADEDDREDYEEEDLHCTKERVRVGDRLTIQAVHLLKRAIKIGKDMGDWNVVGEAAYGLVNCYGSINAVEGAKALLLYQSCLASGIFEKLFVTASEATSREYLFSCESKRFQRKLCSSAMQSTA